MKISAIAIISAIALILPRLGWAQLPVTDPPVELATGQIAQITNQMLLPIQQTAASLTIGSPGVAYQPNTPIIAALDQILFRNVNSQNFSQIYPGWKKLPDDATDYSVQQVATTMAFYQNVIAIGQQHSQELQSEDLTRIVSEIHSPTTLGVLQGIGDALVADIEEKRMDRQLRIVQVTMEAVHDGEELTAEAQTQATSANQPILLGGWGS